MPIPAHIVIQIAACHTCCAFRGEQCTFAPVDDPEGRKWKAKESHPDRIRRATKIFHDFETLPVDKLDGIWQSQSIGNAD